MKKFRFCIDSILAIITIYLIGPVTPPLLHFLAIFGAYWLWYWIIGYSLSFIMIIGVLRDPVLYDIIMSNDPNTECFIKIGKHLMKTPSSWAWKLFQFLQPDVVKKLKDESL